MNTHTTPIPVCVLAKCKGPCANCGGDTYALLACPITSTMRISPPAPEDWPDYQLCLKCNQAEAARLHEESRKAANRRRWAAKHGGNAGRVKPCQ
jgi:hypothetical protein